MWLLVYALLSQQNTPTAPTARELEIAQIIEDGRNSVPDLSYSGEFKMEYKHAPMNLLQGVIVSNSFKRVVSEGHSFLMESSDALNQGKLMIGGKMIAAWDGEKTRIRDGSYSLQKQESNYTSLEPYAMFLGWANAPLSRSEAAADQGFWIPEGIRRGVWRLKADGSLAVFERLKPFGRVELDAAKKYAPIRVRLDDHSPDEYVCEHFELFGGGKIFLPRKITGTRAFVYGKESTPKMPFTLNVTDISTEKPDPEIFRFKPKPGEHFTDHIKRVTYTYRPADDGTLDRAAEEVARLLPGRPINQTGMDWMYWLRVVGLAAIGAGVALAAWRKWGPQSD